VRSIKNTVRLRAASDDKSLLAGSEFHTVKILKMLMIKMFV